MMRLAAHIIATFANLGLIIFAMGIGAHAPTGGGGLTMGFIAALCAFNMYAHIHIAEEV